MSGARRPLPQGPDWSFEALGAYDEALEELAAGYGLEGFPHRLEIIGSEQMMDAYAASGMPVYYHHWSFGKRFLETQARYRRGELGLAYEIVINSDPCLVYLMEENTMVMQALVIAHAAYGHNAFFRGNHLFRQWTRPASILDELVAARDFLSGCEERYGGSKVERTLDACHALMNLGVDRHPRMPEPTRETEAARMRERSLHLQAQVNELWRTLPGMARPEAEPAPGRFPREPEENLLRFIECHAPNLEPWQREVVGIVRRIAQYFHPQRQTQVMNEGWATFWHHLLLHDLYDQGRVEEGFLLAFLHAHTSVVHQPPFHARHYAGLNPYALGFAIWKDLRRICETPTREDRAWFPDVAGSPWRTTLGFAMEHFRDESFIAQFLSPKVMRDLGLFAIADDDRRDRLWVPAIHDEQGYRTLRRLLADQYDLGSREPNLQVWSVDLQGDRTLTLRHLVHQRRPLAEDCGEVLAHAAFLWGFPVRLEAQGPGGEVKLVMERAPEG